MQDRTSRGKKNLKYDYMMLKLGVGVITQEKDPGRIVSSCLKSLIQCTVAARRAKKMLRASLRGLMATIKRTSLKFT